MKNIKGLNKDSDPKVMSTFTLKLSENFVSGNEVLSGSRGQEVQVLSEPFKVNRWWRKVFNLLTFGLFFKAHYEYRVKLV